MPLPTTLMTSASSAVAKNEMKKTESSLPPTTTTTAVAEYEEVVLRRESAAVRLGLTLAYDGDHCATDIFVHQIDPDSVAARCGRIRVGDQLLQINGETIHRRRDLLREFARRPNEVVLLVGRVRQAPLLLVGDDQLQDYEEEEADGDDCLVIEEEDEEETSSSIFAGSEDDNACCSVVVNEEGSIRPLVGPNHDEDDFSVTNQYRRMRHSSSLSPVENLRRRDSSIDRDIESLRLEMAAIQRQCQRLVKHRHHLQRESNGPPAAGRDEDSALVQPVAGYEAGGHLQRPPPKASIVLAPLASKEETTSSGVESESRRSTPLTTTTLAQTPHAQIQMFTASIGGSTKTSNLSASDHRHDRRQCAVVVPQLVPLRLPKLRHEEDHHWDEEEDCHTPYHHNGKKTQAYAKTDVGQPRVDSVDSAVAVVSPSSTADSCSIANAGGGERTEKEGEVEESSHYYHRIIDIVDSSDDVEDGNGGRKSHRWQRPPSATPSTTPTTTMTVVNHNANNNNTSSSRSETVTIQQPKTTKKNNGKAVTEEEPPSLKQKLPLPLKKHSVTFKLSAAAAGDSAAASAEDYARWKEDAFSMSQPHQRRPFNSFPLGSVTRAVSSANTSGIGYKPGDIFYTSADRLADTIALQQRLLLETLATEEKEGSKLSEMEEHFGQWRRPGSPPDAYSSKNNSSFHATKPNLQQQQQNWRRGTSFPAAPTQQQQQQQHSPAISSVFRANGPVPTVASFFAQQLVPATATNHHSTKQQHQSVANFPAAAGGQGMKPHQQQWATPPHRVRQQTPSTPAAMKRASDSRRGDIGPHNLPPLVEEPRANRASVNRKEAPPLDLVPPHFSSQHTSSAGGLWLPPKRSTAGQQQQRQQHQVISTSVSTSRQSSATPVAAGDFFPAASKHHHPSTNDEPKYEWRIKRRSDGSVRFTRHPVVGPTSSAPAKRGTPTDELKARRAAQLARERPGFSTDDDAASELGRFWTREQRRLHVERARQRKAQESADRDQRPSRQQQHQKPTAGIIGGRASNLVHTNTTGTVFPGPAAAISLGSGHLARLTEDRLERQRRNCDRDLKDTFQTIQTFLAHGGRPSAGQTTGQKQQPRLSPFATAASSSTRPAAPHREGGGMGNGLLSVTTV